MNTENDDMSPLGSRSEIDIDLARMAVSARSALALVSTELKAPSNEVFHALAVLERLLDSIDAGIHPRTQPDDPSLHTRWPTRPHWDKWADAIETLAAASGGSAFCGQKYQHLRVDMRFGSSHRQQTAFLDLCDLIELVSDYEESSALPGS